MVAAMASEQNPIDRRLSVAPMMDRTDRHARYFLRLIAKPVLLYTEMIPTGAILHGQRGRFLALALASSGLTVFAGGKPRAATLSITFTICGSNGISHLFDCSGRFEP